MKYRFIVDKAEDGSWGFSIVKKCGVVESSSIFSHSGFSTYDAAVRGLIVFRGLVRDAVVFGPVGGKAGDRVSDRYEVVESVSSGRADGQTLTVDDSCSGLVPVRSIDALLAEAKKIVSGERREAYGHPKDNFSDIAKVWSVLFKVEVTAMQVALAMIMLKVLRENHSGKWDNLVDLIGYTECIALIQGVED